jgi:hypothetical protein
LHTRRRIALASNKQAKIIQEKIEDLSYQVMQAQKLLIFALVAGLLLLQLTPPALARTGTTEDTDSTETETTETTETTTGDTAVTDGGDALTCIVSIVNFVIAQINTLIPAIGLGFAACEVPCSAAGTTGACVGCIAAVIPAIPTIPTDFAGCS